MSEATSSSDRSRGLGRVLAVTLAAALAVILVFQLAVIVLDRPFSFVSREPQKALDGVWYAGSLSNVGAVVWVVGATTCALAWLTLSGRANPARSPQLHGALILAVVGADDLFLLHDELYVKVVPELAVYAVYFALIAAYVVLHREYLRLNGGFVLLPLALLFFGASIAMDQFWDGHHVYEDGAKLLGIATLVLLFSRAALNDLRDTLGRPGGERARA